MTERSRTWTYDLLAMTILLVGGVLLYGDTLQVPWYFDDEIDILENPLVRNLGGSFWQLFSHRGVAFFSFAINYRLGELDPAGYHLVNIVIHLFCSALVYLLLQHALGGRRLFACLGALLFLAHPLQTQAVTYVVQRMTSLAALLFLLALYLFVRARLELAKADSFAAPRHLGWYGGALLAGALAVYTKENTIILPLALLLFARCFLPGEQQWRPLLLAIAPFALVPLLFAGQYLLLPLLSGVDLQGLTTTGELVSSQGNSPLRYLVTEFSVLWIYLRLLFFPYGQALDHNYPLVASLLSWRNAVAFCGLASLGFLAFQLRRRRPLIAAGIAWFFLTLAVESSIIPLDPLFEHRLYLPMFGFILALLGLVELLPGPRQQTALLCLILLVMGGLTFRRNHLWNDPVSFYQENLRRVPTSERVRVNLARSYMRTGRVQLAETLLLEAIGINPDNDSHYINLSKIYSGQKRYPEALHVLQQGLALNPGSVKLHNNLGGLYDLLGQPQQAIAALQQALALDPHFAPAYTNLGVVYGGLGDWSQDERLQRRAIEEFSQAPQAHYNLGLALYNLERPSEALAAFRQALLLNPEDTGALFMSGLAAAAAGDPAAAAAALARLRQCDAALATKLQLRMAAQRQP